MPDEYRCFWTTSSGEVDRERLLAEAFEVGADGAEEVEAADRFRACIYGPARRIEAIRERLLELAIADSEIGPAEMPPPVDWSEAWKEGLEALRISQRLVVRPPFVDFALEPSQQEIVIDPGQAFGTGDHASTALCLEWIDALLSAHGGPSQFDRVLDVGTGSGVLALAALALGSERAVGFDLDPIAIEAAKAAAVRNGLAGRVAFFAGPIAALAVQEGVGGGSPTGTYPLVLANLLKSEMLPIAGEMARRVAPDGRLVLSGLLEDDAQEVLAHFAREGFGEVGRRGRVDATGYWIAPCLARV
ncbi:MAG: 50S ribosomal protein L11 methyltransferase [Deltaproteobacteria bacterium]|nr:50S ribosomal protein L11 methyltransferase [Deltaproteobacteria bacterium]